MCEKKPQVSSKIHEEKSCQGVPAETNSPDEKYFSVWICFRRKRIIEK